MGKKKLVFLILGLLIVVLMVGGLFLYAPANKEKSFFSARIQSGLISLEWKIPAPKVTLTITDKTGANLQAPKQMKATDKYLFTEGTHGQLYTFNLSYVDDKGKKLHQELKRIFLDFNKLPELMTLYIDTMDGKDPIFETSASPKGLMGRTIIKNDYKKAVLNNDISLKIRARGNSSASAYNGKTPYKLLFKKKIDLLDLGEEYADKDWYLMPAALLRTYLGLHLGKQLGMEWEPRTRFVNLMLNGDWKGLYLLSESVKRHPKRVDLKKKGYLIESDVYFWREKGNFFAGSLLAKTVRFTFKYPKIGSKFDPRALAIQKQIKTLEDAIKTNSPHLDQLIDFHTFCAWAIVHEMLGTRDGYGSNKYFYKRDMSTNNRLKMGPLWDFDSTFSMKDNEHSAYWDTESSYFPFLLKNTEFRKHYKEMYFSVSPSVEQTMRSVLQAVKTIPGLEDSWKLNTEIWGKSVSLDGYETLNSAINSLLGHLHKRINFLNEEIAKL